MKSFILSGVLFISAVAFDHASAQVTAGNVAQGIGTFAGLINAFTQTIVKATGGLLMALAMVAFFYGLVEFIWATREGKPDKIESGKKFMVWALIALFVMFSVYGIIKFAQGTLFGGQDVSTITIPELNFQNASGQRTTGQGSPLAPVTGQPINSGGTYRPSSDSNAASGCSAYSSQSSCGTNSDCVWEMGSCQSVYGVIMNSSNGQTTGGSGTYRPAADSQAAYDSVPAASYNPAADSQAANSCSIYTSSSACAQAGCTWESLGGGNGVCSSGD